VNFTFSANWCEGNHHPELGSRITPEHFRFGIKAHQVITQHQELKGNRGLRAPLSCDHRTVSRRAQAWAGAVFNCRQNLKGRRCLCSKTFCRFCRAQCRAAFEFRQRVWFRRNATLGSAAISQYSPPAFAEDPKRGAPPLRWSRGEFCYLPFPGKPSYSAEGTPQHGPGRIRGHLTAGRDVVLAYFKHEETPGGRLFRRWSYCRGGEGGRSRLRLCEWSMPRRCLPIS